MAQVRTKANYLEPDLAPPEAEAIEDAEDYINFAPYLDHIPLLKRARHRSQASSILEERLDEWLSVKFGRHNLTSHSITSLQTYMDDLMLLHREDQSHFLLWSHLEDRDRTGRKMIPTDARYVHVLNPQVVSYISDETSHSQSESAGEASSSSANEGDIDGNLPQMSHAIIKLIVEVVPTIFVGIAIFLVAYLSARWTQGVTEGAFALGLACIISLATSFLLSSMKRNLYP